MPNLGQPGASGLSLRPGASGVTLEGRDHASLFMVAPEYSDHTGLSVNATLATRLGETGAVGILVGAGAEKSELLLNAGFDLASRQRLVLTLGQLRQSLDYGFVSGVEQVRTTQNSGAVSYQYRPESGVIEKFEVNGYQSDIASRDLADRTYSVDTATLYELWNGSRRIAGGRVTGLQGRVGFALLPGASLNLGLGAERLQYDLQAGKERSDRLTGGLEWRQQLGQALNLTASADRQAAQDRYALGLERQLGNGQRLGVSLADIQGRDGAPDDRRIQLNWTLPFGATTPPSAINSSGNATSLLDQVAQRPGFLTAQVVAKVDTTAAPTRQIVIAKAGLPAGASITGASGDISMPLGVAVTGIADVTRNGGAFANGGQFALSGNNLVVKPGLIEQPAAGVTDSYVVTVNNAGGGTTLATISVSHGSVKIESITIMAGAPIDTTPPTASSFTTVDNGGSPSATVDFSPYVADNITPVDQLQFEVITNPQGVVITGVFPNFTFSARPYWAGSAPVDYRVRDSAGFASDIATVTIRNIDGF